MQSNSLQLVSPPNRSLNLLSSTRSSKPSFPFCPSPLPYSQINWCPLLHRSAADRPGSAPVCTCGWEFGRNLLPPLPRCCHQRAVGHACAANEKPHMSRTSLTVCSHGTHVLVAFDRALCTQNRGTFVMPTTHSMICRNA
jgi:hypothetical protein